MTKKVLIFLMWLLCFFTVGCSNSKSETSKPNNVSQGMYDLGVKAVKITDKYLDADLTLDEAYEELESIDNQSEQLIDEAFEGDEDVSFWIGIVKNDFWTMTLSVGAHGTDAHIKESESNLKKILEME